MEVLTGVLFHAAGASCASLCYTPQKKVSNWSWQTYWLGQAFFCWLLLPVLIAWITVPDLFAILQEAPKDAMRSTFLLGMAYGIGGTAFGIAIRFVGLSLTYAISVGISCVIGTLLPPLVHGTLSAIFQQQGSGWILTGIITGAAGIAACGLAGRLKEKDIEKKMSDKPVFSLAKGLPVCLFAGMLSALYGFAIDQGQPIAAVAVKHGSENFQANVIYIFSSSGAFFTTLIYCLYLHMRQKTFAEYTLVTNERKSRILFINFAMAALTGLLWYAQFFFYGLGHIRMGSYKFSSWAIHMVMVVLLSAVAGLLLKEWKGCSAGTKYMLAAALVILITAVLMLTWGNYMAGA